jgi:hypothetical protein
MQSFNKAVVLNNARAAVQAVTAPTSGDFCSKHRTAYLLLYHSTADHQNSKTDDDNSDDSSNINNNNKYEKTIKNNVNIYTTTQKPPAFTALYLEFSHSSNIDARSLKIK